MFDLIGFASMVCQALIALAIAWVGWRIYKHTREFQSATRENALRNAIDRIHSMALAHDKNLQVLDSLSFGTQEGGLESARKRWLILLLLHTHQELFVSSDIGMRKERQEHRDTQLLDVLLQDADTMSVLREGGIFDVRFVQFCEQRLAGVLR